MISSGVHSRKRASFAVACAGVALLTGGAEALAQLDGRRIEVGAQFSWLRRSDRNVVATLNLTSDPCTSPQTQSTSADSTQSPGFGGRLGYSFSSHIALEGEFNYFPRQPNPLRLYFCPGPGFGTINPDGTTSSFPGTLLTSNTGDGHKAEALFGPKFGGHFKEFGLFGKLRPGFVRFSEVVEGGAETNFAVDLGGVIEYYLSSRTLIRMDMSDLIIRFGKREAFRASLSDFLGGSQSTSSPTAFVEREVQTTHNFRLGVGFGFRF